MYYNGKTLDPKWVDDEARKIARELLKKDVNSDPIKSSQLRKFYADVKGLERSWTYRGCSDEAFLGILPQIKILKAKAAYALGRKVVPKSFAEWINRHADAVSTPQDFKAFLLHFEAVVGFCYGEGLKD